MISFVVPAHNEEQLLGRTLDSLRAAGEVSGHPFEIVVVDDASTDRTAAIAVASGVRLVRVAHRQISRTRNEGGRAASGSRLVFVDADTVVPPETVRATLAALDSGAVGGGATVFFDGRLPVAARLLLPLFRAGMRALRLAAGCYVFCSRAAFEATGGFDERLFASEEVAFSRSLRRVGRVVILREPVVSSGRKVRTSSTWEMTRFALTAIRRGPGVVRSRTHLDLWYGDRRRDPERDPEALPDEPDAPR
jgi:GT2 family glycosyltransferase